MFGSSDEAANRPTHLFSSEEKGVGSSESDHEQHRGRTDSDSSSALVAYRTTEHNGSVPRYDSSSLFGNESEDNIDFDTIQDDASGSADEVSVLETDSNPSSPPQYQFAFPLPPSSSNNFVPKPAPTPAQRRAAARARNAARPPNLVTVSGFHRPLPLRSYESEAFLFPTTRLQGGENAHRRSTTATSPIRGRHALHIGGLDEMTRRIGPSNFRVREPSRNTSAASFTSLPRNSTQSSMLLSRTFIDAETLASNPLGDVYRSVTEAYMRESLDRTRERGAQLPTVQLASLPPFEITWRDVNEQLLVAIYGRKNVALTVADVHFVDRIAREMREGVGTISGYEWVGQLFQPN